MAKQTTLLLILLGGLLAITTLVQSWILYTNDGIAPSTAATADTPPPPKKKKKTISSEALTVSVRLRDFVPLPHPPEVLAETGRRSTGIDFHSIATKWELPAGGIDLLRVIQSRKVAVDYNRTTDILALRHPLKTGGTSFSQMLEKIFSDRIIPGSGKSGWFNSEKFSAALENYPHTDPFWDNMAVLYTHTHLRPIGLWKGSNLLEILRKQIPALREKRFRLMTIVRRPLDLAASSFYETQCKIGTFANQRGPGTSCPPVNLTDVKLKNIEHKTKKCEEISWTKGDCQKLKEVGGEKFYEHCGSIEKLFENGSVHNQHYKTLSGEFPRPPELGDDVDKIGINLTPTLEDVSLYTLRDLGGLIDYNPVHKEDFVWFAITERFTESMCLFYYRFEVEPMREPKAL